MTKHLAAWEKAIRRIGYHPGLNGHEKRKLGIFNLLNTVFGIILGIVIPATAAYAGTTLSPSRWCLLSAGPILITVATLIQNHIRWYESARTSFFILHPLLLAIIYIFRIDLGTDLFFICFGVLSVFFLQNIQSIIFTFSTSLTCYFLALGFVKESGIDHDTSHIDIYLFNRLLAIFFIFYGIFIVRNENSRYQLQLEQQARQLADLNSLKNKLFSVISHDLRGPLYALHHLFQGVAEFGISPEEMKILIPEIARDLGETTGHLENLLQWSKSQMQAQTIRPQTLQLAQLSRDVLRFLRLQLESKNLHIENDINKTLFVYADREMINLVLRNLLSNAIKFTPEGGVIAVGAIETPAHIEIFVRDSGIGISADDLRKIEQNIQHSTKGTGNESGTGLGLMLCREFLQRNGGRLTVASQPGMGATFSFILPKRQ